MASEGRGMVWRSIVVERDGGPRNAHPTPELERFAWSLLELFWKL